MSRTFTSLLRALIAAAICAPTVFACLNPIGEGYLGQYINLDEVKGKEIVTKLTSHRDRAYWEDVLKQLLQKKRERSDEYWANNHAVALAHLGRVKEAIAILLEIERREPGQYSSAANLGTAYELNGEDEKALKWIKEGFERNNEGHSGSEWLHVKILEAKLMLKEDASWLKRDNTVLNIGFDQQTVPSDLHTTDHRGQRRSLKEIESALIYQLHERLEFIKPPEPVVADLLADLSSVFAITRTSEDSQAVYDLAKSYGTTRVVFVKPPVVATPPAVATDIPASESWSVKSIGLVIVSVLGLFLALVLTFRLFSRANR